MSFDWKKTLGTVAPALATALGGPMAGVAAKMATDALGLSEGDEGALAAAVASGDTNTLAKLKEIDAQFQLEMRKLGVDIERVHAEDRASARSLGEKSGLLPQAILSFVFVSGYVTVLWGLLAGHFSIPKDEQQAVLILFGIMTAGVTQILNYWFGSSSGSKDKTKALAGATR